MDGWLEKFERDVCAISRAEGREEGLLEGFAIGWEEERIKSGYYFKPAVFKMLSKNYTKEEIADIFSITLDLVEQIAEEKATYDKLAALEKENMFLKAELERWRALKAKISSDSVSKSS